ncbi:hypothetical protein GCM10009630_47280 [Kribbella jejuensis]|uniref:Uncharacterized protein n=1 Tax=Kribbella jejuensis TaxID=236068 RepID=A0A542E783_9ACTN|nr:hypothetical protein [Kribbella jejuensis]TQJ11116.1 hypothetical protein FB475_4024 [Kribbella jejuensis]
MRRTVATAAAVALFTATQTTPALAAPPAPTDVQVNWADANLHLVRTSWSGGGADSKARIEYQDGSAPTEWFPTTGNQFARNWAVRYGKVARVAVVTTDAAGASAPAYSPWFDTNLAGAPKITAAVPQANGSVQLIWLNTAAPADTTPGDPLDLPPSQVGKVRLQFWSWPNGAVELVPYALDTTTAVVPPRPHPQNIWVLATNEWASAGSEDIHYDDMKLFVTKAPAYGVFGKPMAIRGMAGANDGDETDLYTGSNIQVTMQTRATASKPWAYAGRYESSVHGFLIEPVAVGGREYRFYVPAWRYDEVVTGQVISASTYIPTLADFAVAGFNVRTAQVGQMVKLTVDVRPGGTVKGALQRWDGKYWRTVLPVPVTKGKAVMYVRAAGRGTTTTYRVAVPGMTYYGLPIQTTGSRSFTLAVR